MAGPFPNSEILRKPRNTAQGRGRIGRGPAWRQSGAVLAPPILAAFRGAKLTPIWRQIGADSPSHISLAPNWRHFGAVLAPHLI